MRGPGPGRAAPGPRREGDGAGVAERRRRRKDGAEHKDGRERTTRGGGPSACSKWEVNEKGR